MAVSGTDQGVANEADGVTSPKDTISINRAVAEKTSEIVDKTLVPRADPDAQTTVSDFLDFTEYLPSDVIRSLTLIGKLDEKYAEASIKLDTLTTTWGNLPNLAVEDRPSSVSLRADISDKLDQAMSSRVYAHDEAVRMAENVDRHYNKIKVLKEKLQDMMKNYPTEEPKSPVMSKSPQAVRAKVPVGEDGHKIRRHRIPKVTVPGEVLAPYEIEYDTGTDDSDISTDDDSDIYGAGARRIPATPRIRIVSNKTPKSNKGSARPTSHSSAALSAAAIANAAALLHPPPENAVIGSGDAPWLQLTDYELAKLRKRMKKNATWTPSETMVARELKALGRGPDEYREAKKKAEEEGREFDVKIPSLVVDNASGVQHLPAGAIDAKSIGSEETPTSNRGMKLNEAKKLKREALAKQAAQEAAQEAEESALQMAHAAKLFVGNNESNAKSDPSRGSRETKDINGTNDAKDTKDINDTNDAKDTKDINDTNDAKDIKDINDTNDTNGTNDVRDTKDTNGTNDVRDTEGTKDTEDAEVAKDTRVAKDAKGTNDTNDTMDTKDTKDTKDAKDTKDTRDTQDTQDLKAASECSSLSRRKSRSTPRHKGKRKRVLGSVDHGATVAESAEMVVAAPTSQPQPKRSKMETPVPPPLLSGMSQSSVAATDSSNSNITHSSIAGSSSDANGPVKDSLEQDLLPPSAAAPTPAHAQTPAPIPSSIQNSTLSSLSSPRSASSPNATANTINNDNNDNDDNENHENHENDNNNDVDSNNNSNNRGNHHNNANSTTMTTTMTTTIPIKPPAETPVPLPRTDKKKSITPVAAPSRDGPKRETRSDMAKRLQLQSLPPDTLPIRPPTRSQTPSSTVVPIPDSSTTTLRRPCSRGKATSQEPPSLAADRPRRASTARVTPAPESKQPAKRAKRPAPGVVSTTNSGGSSAVGTRKAAPKKKARATKKEKGQQGLESEMEEVDDEGQPIDPEEPRYCLCNRVSFGTMIQCDNLDHCEREWFHLECVGLEDIPARTTKWYCPDCRKVLNIGEKGEVSARGVRK
ncbi:hypothetical protein E4U48_004387 [Claviceps purpurea]|nr:hypothetical protein E4U48_004387 [Claviceps purpurea]